MTNINTINPYVIPEIRIQVAPEGTPMTIGTDQIFEWPALYTGIGPLPSGVITSYIGDTVSGTKVKNTSRYHATNTPLLFSVSGYSLPESVALSECYWDFGDNNTAIGNPVTHTYTTSNPTIKASVQASFSNGQMVTANKVLGIYKLFQPQYINLVTNPSFEHDLPGGGPAGWTAAGAATYGVAGASLIVVSGISSIGNNSLEVTSYINGSLKGSASIILGALLASTNYVGQIAIRGLNGGEVVDIQTVYAPNNILWSTTQTLTQNFQQITLGPFTTTATQNTIYYLMILTHNGGVALTWFLDAAMIVQGTTSPTYFDGDSYWSIWQGIPGQSTSATLLQGNTVQF